MPLLHLTRKELRNLLKFLMCFSVFAKKVRIMFNGQKCAKKQVFEKWEKFYIKNLRNMEPQMLSIYLEI